MRGARKSVRDFGIHKGEPIRPLWPFQQVTQLFSFCDLQLAEKRNSLKASSYDKIGIYPWEFMNTLISRTKYNPEIGIFGMDVSIALTRPG